MPTKRTNPNKPRKGILLNPNQQRTMGRKIKAKLSDFGSGRPRTTLQQYLDERNDLQAGRVSWWQERIELHHVFPIEFNEMIIEMAQGRLDGGK